jgi:hypothetical protein
MEQRSLLLCPQYGKEEDNQVIIKTAAPRTRKEKSRQRVVDALNGATPGGDWPDLNQVGTETPADGLLRPIPTAVAKVPRRAWFIAAAAAVPPSARSGGSSRLSPPGIQGVSQPANLPHPQAHV